MEPKKNPKYDIHRHRNVLFTIGLICSLSIVIMAFRWESQIEFKIPTEVNTAEEVMVYVPPTDSYYEISKPQPVRQTSSTEYVEVKEDPIIDINIPDLMDEPESNPIVDIGPVVLDGPGEVIPDEPFIFVEKMPEPDGGYAKFYEQVRKSLRYPRQASRMDIEGKVFVQFVVNEQGELSNMKVIKGIGAGCDEEAMRVLKLTKWSPGKQRGVPVKVKMTQTIIFSLNR